MAWNNKQDTKKQTNLFTSIQNTYLEFLNTYTSIKEFYNEVDTIELNDYKNKMKSNHIKIKQVNEKLIDLYRNIEISSSDRTLDLSQRGQIEKIKENLTVKEAEFKEIVLKLIEKEKETNRRLSFYRLKTNDDDYNTNHSNNKNISSRQQQEVTAFEMKEAIEVKDNLQYMDERTKELEEIAKVTYQIKDITSHMKVEVQKQGELLNHVEDAVVDVKENVINADREIVEADKMDKSCCKKGTLLIIFIILVVVLAVIGVCIGILV